MYGGGRTGVKGGRGFRVLSLASPHVLAPARCRDPAACVRAPRRTPPESVLEKRGRSGMRRERPGALLARRTRGLGRPSFDARSRGQPWPLPSILGRRSGGKRKEGRPDDSLCSRNARSQTPLGGRAHVGKPSGRPSKCWGKEVEGGSIDAWKTIDQAGL